MMRPEGFDDAIIGIEPNTQQIIYDRDKMISIAVEDMEMDHQEAIEYLEYNVWGAYVGEFTPIYIQSCTYDDLEDFLD